MQKRIILFLLHFIIVYSKHFHNKQCCILIPAFIHITILIFNLKDISTEEVRNGDLMVSLTGGREMDQQTMLTDSSNAENEINDDEVNFNNLYDCISWIKRNFLICDLICPRYHI